MATLTEVTSGNLASFESKGCLGVQVGDRVLESTSNNENLYWREDRGDFSSKFASNSRSVKLYIVGGENKWGRIRLYSDGGGGVDSGGNPTTYPLIITNAGGQVSCKADYAAASGIWLAGWQNTILTGEYNPILGTGNINYQGHRGDYNFQNGKYGFDIIELQIRENQFSATQTGFKNVEVSFVEFSTKIDAFAGMRIKADGYPDPTYFAGIVRVHDCLSHSSFNGEGAYLSETTEDGDRHSMLLYFYNNRLVNTAAEVAQLGKMNDGSRVFNNIMINGGNDYIHAFQQSQSSNLQTTWVNGNVTLENNVVIGATGNIQNIQHHETSNPSLQKANQHVKFVNNFFGDIGRNAFWCKEGVGTNWIRTGFIISSNYYRNKNYRQYRLNSSNTVDNFLMFGANSLSETRVSIANNITDYSILIQPSWVATPAVHDINNSESTAITPPSFVNSGFDDATMDYTLWEEYTYLKGDVAGSEAGDPLDFDQGMYVRHFDTWELYKAKIDVNQSVIGEMNPGTTSGWETYWEAITWNGNTEQPMDYRLTSNDPYNKLGMGLFDNEEPDTETVIKWEYCYDDGANAPDDSFIVKFGPWGATNEWVSDKIQALDLDGSFSGHPKWIRKGVKVRSQDAREGTFTYTPWIKIS